MKELAGQRIVDAGTTPRQILMATHNVIELPGPITIDGTNSQDGANTGRVDELRAGWLMAQITATKKWVPCKRSQANGAGSSATALIVDNAGAFIAGETLQIGSTTGVISSVNYSTNTITLTASKSWSDNDVVYTITLKDGTTTAAGAEIARAILANTVRLLSGVPFETTQLDKEGVLFGAGYFDSTMILGDKAAILATGVTNYLVGCLWSDQKQAV